MATTYYIDFLNGNDANNGLSPDASASTNKPWKTIAKALGASGMASGDTAYLAPVTFREQITIAMTSAVAETPIKGDPFNAQGFKDGSGNLLAPGMVILTGYDVSDTAVPTGANPTLTLAGRDYLTFQFIWFIGGKAGQLCLANTNTSQNMTFKDCGFEAGAVGAQTIFTITTAANTALNWTITRCIFRAHNASTMITITPTVHSAEYNLNFVCNDTLFIGASIVCNPVLGSASSPGGGITFQGCTFTGQGSSSIFTSGTNVPATYKVNVYDCLFYTTNGVNATTSGQIVEDYNIFHCNTARTNVTAGAHSVSDFSKAPMFHFGQGVLQGFNLHAFMQPIAGSPLLAFGTNGGGSATDLYNRARLGGASNAVGAMENYNLGVFASPLASGSIRGSG